DDSTPAPAAAASAPAAGGERRQNRGEKQNPGNQSHCESVAHLITRLDPAATLNRGRGLGNGYNGFGPGKQIANSRPALGTNA
ncbi:hypothetical protein, partial [Brevundimonas sp.]|uniref:hypothetical protein n=1 Tax=Brevundimonas sp. TaxID=1871086 RepID=UPI0025BF3E5D